MIQENAHKDSVAKSFDIMTRVRAEKIVSPQKRDNKIIIIFPSFYSSFFGEEISFPRVNKN